MKIRSLPLALVLAATACSGGAAPTGVPDAAVYDAGRDAQPGTLGGEHTYDYVVSTFLIDSFSHDPVAGQRSASGFNLDGRASTDPTGANDCDTADALSLFDPDQNHQGCTPSAVGCLGGVDNQLPSLAHNFGSLPPLMHPRVILQRRIQSGQLAYLLRVAGVDGVPSPTLQDDRVTVSLYPVARPTRPADFVAGQPGQEYRVDPESLTSDGSRARLQFEGRIVYGRLIVEDMEATGAAWPFLLPFSDTASLPLSLRGFRLRVNLGVTGGTDGNLGGFMEYGAFVEAMAATPGLGSSTSQNVLETLLRGFADLALDDTGRPTREDCTEGSRRAVSFGMGFALTAAVIDL